MSWSESVMESLVARIWKEFQLPRAEMPAYMPLLQDESTSRRSFFVSEELDSGKLCLVAEDVLKDMGEIPTCEPAWDMVQCEFVVYCSSGSRWIRVVNTAHKNRYGGMVLISIQDNTAN